MAALRHVGTSTGASASVVSALLKDNNLTKITFFATESSPNGHYNEKSDGPEANLPMVAAIAEYNIPGFDVVHLVFDGIFLTRARTARALEVDLILEEAIACGRANYATSRAPFTSSFSPEVAASVLAKAHSFPLDHGSLGAYVRLFEEP